MQLLKYEFFWNLVMLLLNEETDLRSLEKDNKFSKRNKEMLACYEKKTHF
jgi:hypothetical protein